MSLTFSLPVVFGSLLDLWDTPPLHSGPPGSVRDELFIMVIGLKLAPSLVGNSYNFWAIYTPAYLVGGTNCSFKLLWLG